MKRIYIFNNGQDYADWLYSQNKISFWPIKKDDVFIVVKRFEKEMRRGIPGKIIRHIDVKECIKQIILDFKHQLWIDTHYGEFFGGSDI